MMHCGVQHENRSASYEQRLEMLLGRIENTSVYKDIDHHMDEWVNFKQALQQLVQAQPVQERRRH